MIKLNPEATLQFFWNAIQIENDVQARIIAALCIKKVRK